MEKDYISIYCGKGQGKTSSAIGQGILAASRGESVIIIQFLKKKQNDDMGFIRRLEPEIKVFRFEKSDRSFEELTEEERREESQNLKNGVNFARKVLITEECDVLILDEILGLLEYGILTKEELASLLQADGGNTKIILTGIYQGEDIWELADHVTEMVTRR